MKSSRVILPLLFAAWSASAAPTPPVDVVYGPLFHHGKQTLAAGTAFVVQMPEGTFLLTAQHLFGPAGDLPRDLTPEETKQFVSSMSAVSLMHPAVKVASSEMLLIPSAKKFSEDDAGHDVAAFRLGNYKGGALTLAGALPGNGESVYLLAVPRGEQKLRLVPAKVIQAGVTALEYAFDEGIVNLGATSGAPVLNEKGEVVGINLGGGTMGSKTVGIADPVTSFGGLVSAAAAKPK